MIFLKEGLLTNVTNIFFVFYTYIELNPSNPKDWHSSIQSHYIHMSENDLFDEKFVLDSHCV